MRKLAALLFVAACAHRATPEDAARAWADAVRRDDADAAYKLLSDETRRELSRDQFLLRWRSSRDLAKQTAAQIDDGARKGALEGARVRYGEGLAVPMVFDRAPPGWHLDDVPSQKRPHATTPEEALEAFTKALDARDWEAMSKLLTAGTRETVDRELRERAQPLHESPKVEVNGEKGRVRLGRYELLLERGPAGEWQVTGVK